MEESGCDGNGGGTGRIKGMRRKGFEGGDSGEKQESK